MDNMIYRYGIRALLPMAGLVLALGSCIRDELEPCPPLRVSLGVEDKNYVNIAAAARLGYEEELPTDLPFREYVSDLAYSVVNIETGDVVAERALAKVEGDAGIVDVALPNDLPYGKYLLKAWGNIGDGSLLGANLSSLELHPDGIEGPDSYFISDTLDYALGSENFSCGMKRVKGKMIIATEKMPKEYGFSEWQVSDIMSHVDDAWQYGNPITMSFQKVWNREEPKMLAKCLLAPSLKRGASLVEQKYHVGSANSGNGNWIAPEDVCVTMKRNELTILRYEYDPCCCRFKIYILINDNWETLHIMDVE